MQNWSWVTWDSYVKALQDLRIEQNLLGRGDRQSLREFPALRQMGANLQRSIVERNRRCVREG